MLTIRLFRTLLIVVYNVDVICTREKSTICFDYDNCSIQSTIIGLEITVFARLFSQTIKKFKINREMCVYIGCKTIEISRVLTLFTN